QTVTGNLVSISEKELVLAAGDKMVTTALTDVLILDLAPPAKMPDGSRTHIELVDGTLLLAKSYLIKKNELTFTPLLGTKDVTIPLATVNNLLVNAQDEKIRKQWVEILAPKRDRDFFAVVTDGIVNPLRGTLGEGSPAGDMIDLTLAAG